MSTRIVVLGDFNPAYSTHHALNESVAHCNATMENPVVCEWISTEFFIPEKYFNGNYAGLWIAPGSPYKNMDHVMEASRYTRTQQIPTLGNCGGFQHMLIEIARNCCGIAAADHEETNPGSEAAVISKLTCSLTGLEEKITIPDERSLLFSIQKTGSIRGKYFCSYGFDENYRALIEAAGCAFTAFSPEGHLRAFELSAHPFFIGSLFQPALTSAADRPDPLIAAFFNACIANAPSSR